MTDIILQMCGDDSFRIVSFPSIVRGCENIFTGQNGFIIYSALFPNLTSNYIFVYGNDVSADRRLTHIYDSSYFIKAIETLREYAGVLGINFKINYGGFK